jgi:hypothetical protein
MEARWIPGMGGKRMERTKRPSGWLYIGATVLPVLGCLATMVLVHNWFPGLPGTLRSRIDIDNLTQVVVPGTKELTFAESGAYAVYYESHSVVDGVVYAGSERPPALACSLTSRASGDEVAVVPDYVPTNTYATRDRARIGVLIRSITIREPGRYLFSCGYPDGSELPRAVLAVGPNLAWEFFGIAARTVVTAAAGLAVLIGSGVLAALVAIIVAVKRRRAGQDVASA